MRFVGFQLLGILVGYLRCIRPCKAAGFLGGYHPESPAGFKIHKGGRHDAVIHKFQ